MSKCQTGCTCDRHKLTKVYQRRAEFLFISEGFTPLEEYKGVHIPLKCRHDCGAVHYITPQSFIQTIKKGSRTAKCECQRGTGSYPRITQEHAFKEMEEAGHKPLEPYLSLKEPWRTIHLECGEERRSTLSSIRGGGIGCYPCSRKTWKHPNALTEEEAVSRMKAKGFTPLEPYISTQAPWKSQHTCGSIVTPTLSNVSNGNGCKACNASYSYDKPARLYLLSNPGLNALKIGVAGEDKIVRRVLDSYPYGFYLVRNWKFSTGQEAYDIEQEVIRHWRNDLNADACVDKAKLPRGGHTETARTRKVGMRKTIDYIERLVA